MGTDNKTCTKCKRSMPATPEYFNKRGENKLRSVCRECNKQQAQKYREAHLEKESEYGKKYYAENRDTIQAKHNQYYQDTKESRHKHHAQYRKANKDKINQCRQNHLEAIKAGQKQWRQTEHGKFVSKTCKHRRRARLKGNGGAYTASQLQEQVKRQRNKCYYCNKKLPKTGWHADHIVPISKGGTNDISNIVISCPTCNLRKGEKLLHEWIAGGKLL